MSGVPIYHSLFLTLRSGIRDGVYPAGSMLPGEVEIARQHGCSRVTVRKALEVLVAEGLVERRQGKGTIVTGGRAVEPVRAEVAGFVENLLAMGLRTQVEVLHFSFEIPPERIRGEMRLEAGRQALHTVRLRNYKEKPFSYSIAWVPEDVGQTFSRADLAARSLTQLLRQAGVTAVRASQRVFAVAADGVVAPLLGVEPGSPLLGIERRVEDTDGRVVEHLRVFYHPDRYEFEITMESDPRRNDGAWRASQDQSGG